MNMKKSRFLSAVALSAVVLLFADSALAAADYSALTTGITGEQTNITTAIISVAGVLAAIYAVARGASIALSSIRGR